MTQLGALDWTSHHRPCSALDAAAAPHGERQRVADLPGESSEVLGAKKSEEGDAREDLVAGSIAGAAQVCVGHPFDTIKVIMELIKRVR